MCLQQSRFGTVGQVFCIRQMQLDVEGGLTARWSSEPSRYCVYLLAACHAQNVVKNNTFGFWPKIGSKFLKQKPKVFGQTNDYLVRCVFQPLGGILRPAQVDPMASAGFRRHYEREVSVPWYPWFYLTAGVSKPPADTGAWLFRHKHAANISEGTDGVI